MALPTRKLGKIESSSLGFGCMSLTPGFYGDDGIDLVESEKTVRAALDKGCTLLDSADFYTSLVSGATYENLKLLAKVLPDYPREKVTLAVKWGPWIEGGFKAFDNSPEGCKKRVDEALKILGTDYIDFWIYRSMGQPDIHKTSITDVAKGMKAVLDAGKVKAIGVSEVSLEDFKAIQSVVPVSLVELEWSLFARDSEKEIIPYARSIGAGILAYAPMARGMLTGKFDTSSLDKTDFRNQHARSSGSALNNNLKLANLVAEKAKAKGVSSAQLALAWVLAQGDDVVPIPGTKRIKYLEDNLAALDVKLTEEEVEELRSIVPEESVAGGRY